MDIEEAPPLRNYYSENMADSSLKSNYLQNVV